VGYFSEGARLQGWLTQRSQRIETHYLYFAFFASPLSALRFKKIIIDYILLINSHVLIFNLHFNDTDMIKFAGIQMQLSG
jgi:hypothetical protein